jgi:hypothetical protein
MTYEITMEKKEQEEKPKKNLIFKIIHHIEDAEDDHEDIEYDITLITKHF